MTITRDEVINAVQISFKDIDTSKILSVLDLYGVELYENERERVQLAIIELSAGEYDKLVKLVQDAKIDYRDILAWQELGPISEVKGEVLKKETREILKKLNE